MKSSSLLIRSCCEVGEPRGRLRRGLVGVDPSGRTFEAVDDLAILIEGRELDSTSLHVDLLEMRRPLQVPTTGRANSARGAHESRPATEAAVTDVDRARCFYSASGDRLGTLERMVVMFEGITQVIAIEETEPVLATLSGIVIIVGSKRRKHGYVVGGKHMPLVLMQRQL